MVNHQAMSLLERSFRSSFRLLSWGSVRRAPCLVLTSVRFPIQNWNSILHFLLLSLHIFGPSSSGVPCLYWMIYFIFILLLSYLFIIRSYCVLICTSIMSSTLIAALLSVCMLACECVAGCSFSQICRYSVTFVLLTDMDVPTGTNFRRYLYHEPWNDSRN